MDGLSAAASVIAVVQISSQIFELCLTYYLNVKEARNDIERLRNEVIPLQNILTKVADLVEDPGSSRLEISSILTRQDGPVELCGKDLEAILTKLQACYEENRMKKFGLKALKWPFSSKEIEKLIATVARHKITFNLALTGDLVGLTRTIKDDVTKINNGVEELKIGQRTFLADARWQKIYQWLSPPDPSSNFNSACKRRQGVIGEWLLKSYHFEKWKTGTNSFMWLHGIPGCGKTVLSSTIIQETTLGYKSEPSHAVVYFYFDFNDAEKQKHENLLRSLIVQLSMQSETPKYLDDLFARNQDGKQQPSIDALMLTLQKLLESFQQTFIVIDALDECKEREALLGLVEDIAEWRLNNLHILATSRREKDIEECLESLATDQICIRSSVVNKDIHAHIRERLQNDPKLRKWPINVQNEIEKALMDGAHGMFRWVVCQLDALKKCLKVDALRKTLRSLPKTLDDTYAQILCSIDEEYHQDAFKILQWLAYSARPLAIEEVAEMLAVEIDNNPRFNPEKRLRDPRDILTICSSLVTTVAATQNIQLDGNFFSIDIEELRLAHFSVKEYLVSDRVRIGPASLYEIGQCANEHICRTCLIYLLQFNESVVLTSENFLDFKLARYAAQYWTQHARAVEQDSDRVNQLVLELFQSRHDAYINWIRIFDLDKEWSGIDTTKNLGDVGPPIYYAALACLVEPTRMLLENGVDINAQGGSHGNALQVASRRGSEAVVRILLDNGADVNAQGGSYGNALQAASSRGSEAVVRILLEKGADINAPGDPYSNALQVASLNGNEAVVRILLEKGADINAQGGYYGSALQAASSRGSEAVVRILLEKGADVNAQVGDYGNALQAASLNGSEVVVRILLEKGANVNAPSGSYCSALQAASLEGSEAIVRILLEKGADVNAKGGLHGDALQAASRYGSEAIVRILLEKGADVNARVGYFGNALRAALYHDHIMAAKLLLEKGADRSELSTKNWQKLGLDPY